MLVHQVRESPGQVVLILVLEGRDAQLQVCSFAVQASHADADDLAELREDAALIRVELFGALLLPLLL
ncbi:MAG: hypothetical protein IPL52_00020 [Flavobacteriales bacterium]|nr:hypothetical protein [Flavobacteriales bacterium]